MVRAKQCRSAHARVDSSSDGKPAVALELGNWRPGFMDIVAWADLSPVKARELAQMLVAAANRVEEQTFRHHKGILFETEERIWLAAAGGRSPEAVGVEFGLSSFAVRQICRRFDRVKEGRACAHTREEVRAMPDHTPMSVLTTNIRLSERLRNCLKCIQFETLGELRRQKDHMLLREPGLGRKGLSEIRAYVPEPPT